MRLPVASVPVLFLRPHSQRCPYLAPPVEGSGGLRSSQRRRLHSHLHSDPSRRRGGGGGDDDDDDDDDDMPSLELVDEGFSEETKNDALEVLMGIYGELIQENTLELILKGSDYNIENAVEVSHPHGI